MLKAGKQITTWQRSSSNTRLILNLKRIDNLIKTLDKTFVNSQKNDYLLLMALRMEAVKRSSLELQLQEALQRNQQIMDIVELRNDEGDLSRGCSTASLGPTMSTVSLVNLQFKYEELLVSHRGLLKMFELRNNDIKTQMNENVDLKKQIQKLIYDCEVAKDKITFLRGKIADLKRKKKEKVSRLKAEGQNLALLHRRLVALLHRQCIEKNDFVKSLLQTTIRSEKGLLLQEVQKNNMLTYKNFQLQQEIQLLKSVVEARTSSNSSMG
ncbi:uncharacterized protein [Euwallacea fornicatus]|uniref:uncharacterized protein n=1 Tax=Euwallacea fornicatus TaxID=995702 RepID=UPI00338F08CA